MFVLFGEGNSRVMVRSGVGFHRGRAEVARREVRANRWLKRPFRKWPAGVFVNWEDRVWKLRCGDVSQTNRRGFLRWNRRALCNRSGRNAHAEFLRRRSSAGGRKLCPNHNLEIRGARVCPLVAGESSEVCLVRRALLHFPFAERGRDNEFSGG